MNIDPIDWDGDLVNTDARIGVQVRPFMVPILELAERRMAEKQRDGWTMEGKSVDEMLDRAIDNAQSARWIREGAPADDVLEDMADALALIALGAHLFIREQ